MLVKDILDLYRIEKNYVTNSMILKSFDDSGITYKWLCKNPSGAFRREIFIATSGLEEILENRTVIEYVEINEVK